MTKKFLIFCLFFLFGFSLFGQSIPIPSDRLRDVSRPALEDSFFVLPVRGEGSQEEKTWFYDRLIYELVLQRYTVGTRRNASDYIIRGTVNEGFLIELIRNKSNEVLFEKKLGYTVLNESTQNQIAMVIFDMLNNIPESGRKDIQINIEDEDDPALIAQKEKAEMERSSDWRDKLFFFEYSFLWAPREVINAGNKNPPNKFISKIDFPNVRYLNLGVNLAFEAQFLNFLALEGGVQFIQEISGGENNRDLIFEIFLDLKFPLKLFNNFMIQPYGGVSYNFIPLIGSITPSKFSYFGGLEVCINTKAGILVIEPRLAFDMAESDLGFDSGNNPLLHKRRMLQLGIGFKTGIISKMVEKRD